MLRELSYYAGAWLFMQESPNHASTVLGSAEVDLDQRTELATLETLNQRVRGSSP